jgi:hypothetical protein
MKKCTDISEHTDIPGWSFSDNFILLFLMVTIRCFKEVSGWVDGSITNSWQTAPNNMKNVK